MQAQPAGPDTTFGCHRCDFHPPDVVQQRPEAEGQESRTSRRGGVCALQVHRDGSLAPANTIHLSARYLRDVVLSISLGNHLVRTQRYPHLLQPRRFSWRRPEDGHAHHGKPPKNRHERTAEKCKDGSIRAQTYFSCFSPFTAQKGTPLSAGKSCTHGPAALASQRPPRHPARNPGTDCEHVWCQQGCLLGLFSLVHFPQAPRPLHKQKAMQAHASFYYMSLHQSLIASLQRSPRSNARLPSRPFLTACFLIRLRASRTPPSRHTGRKRSARPPGRFLGTLLRPLSARSPPTKRQNNRLGRRIE